MAYTTTSFMPLKMPTPGSREPAQISLINENMVVVSGHDHANGKGVPVATVRSGLAANRPAPSAAGGIYFATDTGIVSLDNGTTWTDFLTSGGSATVTGWTLIDPVIRDTLQFGPEGSATIDTSLTRVAANALQFSGNVGVGVAPAPFVSTRAAVQVGQGGAFAGDTNQPTAFLSANTYFDGTTNRTLVTGAASLLSLANGGYTFFTAPTVSGAGAAQTFTTRLTVDQSGDARFSAVAGSAATITLDAAADQYKLLRWQTAGSLRWQLGAAPAPTPADEFHLWSYNDAGALTGDRLKVSRAGTVTLAPDAGAGALSVTSISSLQYVIALAGFGGIRLNGASLDLNTVGGAHLYCSPASGYFLPLTNGGFHVGHPSVPVQAVYANTGTIQPSHIDTKENIVPLDPAACAEAVAGTEWWEFDYKVPPPPDGADADQLAAWQKAMNEGAPNRHQRGYVLGSPDHHTDDLFGMGDRRSASPQTDLAVVACALQDALRRLAALEANNATA